jgi:hypothetical protein
LTKIDLPCFGNDAAFPQTGTRTVRLCTGARGFQSAPSRLHAYMNAWARTIHRKSATNTEPTAKFKRFSPANPKEIVSTTDNLSARPAISQHDRQPVSTTNNQLARPTTSQHNRRPVSMRPTNSQHDRREDVEAHGFSSSATTL